MVLPIIETYNPSTASLTGFATNVTGSSWTLSAKSSPDNLAHQVTLQNNSATDYSGHNFTIVGTDQDGISQTETKAMPAGTSTVTSTYYFKTLISVTPAITINSDTMNIGYANTFSSRTIPAAWRGNQAMVAVVVTGTINYSVQYTPDNIQKGATRPYNWLADTGPVVNATTSASTPFSVIPLGWRFIANSYSASATAQLTISQMNSNV